MHVRDLFDLTGQVSLVTGASTGLGLQLARGLAEAGSDLCICARGPERLEEAAALLRAETGRRVLAVACDVSDPQQVESLV